jgi:hypothetical protein
MVNAVVIGLKPFVIIVTDTAKTLGSILLRLTDMLLIDPINSSGVTGWLDLI